MGGICLVELFVLMYNCGQQRESQKLRVQSSVKGHTEIAQHSFLLPHAVELHYFAMNTLGTSVLFCFLCINSPQTIAFLVQDQCMNVCIIPLVRITSANFCARLSCLFPHSCLKCTFRYTRFSQFVLLIVLFLVMVNH